jgi:low temperature requirement protein LtrA
VITQVTQLVEHAHGPMDFLRALLVLVPIWWMYAAYVWLTNTVRVTWQMRLVLIAAMAGFLVMAMAIPQVFGAGALMFGLSYLFVVVLHHGAFALCQGQPKFPQLCKLNFPHRVHDSVVSSARTRPAFSFSLSRYELPRMLSVTA